VLGICGGVGPFSVCWSFFKWDFACSTLPRHLLKNGCQELASDQLRLCEKPITRINRLGLPQVVPAA
jgi:hypothetical protein